MIRLDEDSLICDLAETYHVLDYKALPLHLVAILAGGLSDDSRIKRKVSNRKLSISEALQAAAVDRLSQLVWSKTADAKRGRNRPKSVLEALEHPQEKKKYQAFTSIEAFERKRAQILRS
jgi:hypothetical protein